MVCISSFILELFSAWCKSVVMVFLLYCFAIFQDQCISILLSFLWTFVIYFPSTFVFINWLSKNLGGLSSIFNLIILATSWKTRKIKSLFKFKDENLYPACKIYYGECEQCWDNSIGETVWNTVTHWSEHNNLGHKSEPAEHIKRNIKHVYKWKILWPAPSQKQLRKNLEAIFIALYKSSLNDQKSFDRLMLFRNVITLFLIEIMISYPKG